MDILAQVAEQKILAAINRGELDNLSLQGQPIPREDDSMVPEELRMGYKILKNAGVLPEELQLQKELLRLEDLLKSCEDQQQRQQIKKRLSLQQLNYDLLLERRRPSAARQQYEPQIRRKLRF